MKMKAKSQVTHLKFVLSCWEGYWRHTSGNLEDRFPVTPPNSVTSHVVILVTIQPFNSATLNSSHVCVSIPVTVRITVGSTPLKWTKYKQEIPSRNHKARFSIAWISSPTEISLYYIHSFIQYSVWRQVQSLLQNDAST